MRTPHEFPRNLALITVVLTLLFLVPDARAQVTCETPPAQGKETTWKQDATVHVMITLHLPLLSNRQFKDQLDKWKKLVVRMSPLRL